MKETKIDFDFLRTVLKDKLSYVPEIAEFEEDEELFFNSDFFKGADDDELIEMINSNSFRRTRLLRKFPILARKTFWKLPHLSSTIYLTDVS